MSRQEELLALISSICAILCFGFGFTVAGFVFSVRGLIAFGTSIYFDFSEPEVKKKGF